MTNGIWLIDLANAIRPISKTYFVLYTKQVNNTKKALLSEYRKVVMELREAFQTLSKAVPTTARGSAFNVDFVGEPKEGISIAAKVQKGKGNSLSRSWKRVGINLTKETSSKRLKNLKCLVCNIRGHTLPDYWYLFKSKRPKGFKAVGIYIKRVLIKVEQDKDLAA